MAVARHGTPTSGASAATTSLVVTYITGLSIGDVAIAQFNINTGTGVTATATGWTAVPGFTPQTQSNTSLQILMYRVIDGTEGATVTFTISLSRLLTWNMVAYSGVDKNNPWAGIYQSVAAASATVTFPASTPQTESAYAVLFYAGGNAVGSDTMTVASSGYSIASDVANPSGARLNHSVVQDSHTAFTLPIAAVTPGSSTISPNTENQCKAVIFLRADFSSSSGLVVETCDFVINPTGGTSIVSNPFNAGYAGDVVIVMANAQGASTSFSISNTGGLTFTQQIFTNLRAEPISIWTAPVTAPFTGVTVTATPSGSEFGLLVTTYVIKGAKSSAPFGATNTANGNLATMTASLTTTVNNSWVWAFSGDQTAASTYTVGTAQTLVFNGKDASNGATIAVWRQTSVTPTSGTSVTNNITSPTSRTFNMAVFEIAPAASAATNSGFLMFM